MDKRTGERWKTLALREPMRKKGMAADYTEQKDGKMTIRREENGRCPFLSFDKLCGLTLAYGEDEIPEACRVFPRQMNEYADRLEYSLTPSCPVVVDLLKKRRRMRYSCNLLTPDNHDLRYQLRNLLLHITEEEGYSIEKTLKMNFYILLDLLARTSDPSAERYIPDQAPETGEILLKEYGVRACTALSQEIDRMDGLADGEIVDAEVYYRHVRETFEERNELFLDLAENYRKDGIYTKYLEKIALHAEEFEKGLFVPEELMTDLHVFERQFLRYENLFRNYIAVQIFANIFRAESEIWEMLTAFEWIAMGYAALKHAVFLQWRLGRRGKLKYEPMRDVMVVLTRMMEYGDDDMLEYLENSFQDLIWDWGYMALLAGPGLHIFG